MSRVLSARTRSRNSDMITISPTTTSPLPSACPSSPSHRSFTVSPDPSSTRTSPSRSPSLEQSSLSDVFVRVFASPSYIAFHRLIRVCTVVIIAQLVGAIVASAILDGLTHGPLMVSVSLGADTSRTQGLFIEMFTTAALVLSILMLAAGTLLADMITRSISSWNPTEKHEMTPMAPLGFGLTLFVTMLWSTQFTGGCLK